MNISSVAVETTINYLKSLSELAGRIIVPEFDSQISPIAIHDPIFSVGVEGFEAGEELTAKDSGGNTVPRGAREFRLKMRIRVYCTFANGASRAFVAADYIYTRMMTGSYAYKIASISFDDAQYDSQTESIRLTTHFTVEGLF